MRELTDTEKGELRYGCIFCRSPLFWMGPWALGLSCNIYCTECLAGFNVTHAALPWQLIAEPCEDWESGMDRLSPILDGKMKATDFFAQFDAAIERSVRGAFDRIKKPN